jgi:hypothetical protein
MSRETHVRFWERAAVKARRATRLIVFGEAHLRRILRAYMTHYNEARTHLSLSEDAPIHRRSSGSVGSHRLRYSVASITSTAEFSLR